MGHCTRIFGALLLSFCLFVPVAFAVPLEEVDGTWHLDISTTLEKTTDVELKHAIVARAADFAKFVLHIDAKGHTMMISMPGEQQETVGFAVAREEGKVIVLTTDDSSEMHLEVTGKDTLMMGVVSEGDGSGVESPIYFKR